MTTQLGNNGLLFYIPNVYAAGTKMIKAHFLNASGQQNSTC